MTCYSGGNSGLGCLVIFLLFAAFGTGGQAAFWLMCLLFAGVFMSILFRK